MKPYELKPLKGVARLARMLERAVRLGATAKGSDALSEYKAAYLAYYGQWF